MNKLKIISDGGLANRLNGLVSGLIISDLINYKPHVHWSPNNWCGSHLDDLFNPNFDYDDKSITKVYDENPNSVYYIHENQLNRNIRRVRIENNIDNISNIGEDIIYYNSLIPSYILEKEFFKKLSQIKIKDNILREVKNFCLINGINENSEGIHLRMTDFGNKTNILSALEYVKKNPEKKFFICSDDKNVEEIFLNEKNVVVYRKNNYVEKLNPNLNWNGNIVDSDGRSFMFNVQRSKDSVIESFIDMLILSQTGKRLITSESTFLKFSEFYSKIKIY